jgi:Respiratory-chain NADH dehydrogenase, 49 Kd subunit/Respiratory-chain NADH dehydrogenase, 30 Kd subunit
MTITAGGQTVDGLWRDLKERTAAGERFAGLSAAPESVPCSTAPDHGESNHSKKRWELSAYVARPGGVDILTAALPPGAAGYPALTPRLGAAFWYERVIRDQTGINPEGHPRLAPLVRAGRPDDHALPRHVDGYGLFTIPHGPVRSGVFESMEYLVETPGEAIPHLNMRIFYKHRGIASRFEGAPVADGVLLAERAEGIASVVHALAFCHAIETLSGAEVPREAALVRLIHAELERIANHLDVATRLADAAGLAVATARLALHKEKVLRLVSALCGSRFGRGVVVPGGVAAPPRVAPGDLIAAVGTLEKAVTGDAESLMGTSSFLDRLRGTGPLTPDRAREHGASAPSARPPATATTPAPPARTTPTAASHVEKTTTMMGTRWHACESAGTRWPRLSRLCGAPPPNLPISPNGSSRLPSVPFPSRTAGPSGGPRRRRAKSSTT